MDGNYLMLSTRATTEKGDSHTNLYKHIPLPPLQFVHFHLEKPTAISQYNLYSLIKFRKYMRVYGINICYYNGIPLFPK